MNRFVIVGILITLLGFGFANFQSDLMEEQKTPAFKAAQKIKFKKNKQEFLQKIITLRDKADSWLNLTKSSGDPKIINQIRPNIKQTRSAIYQVQRCAESSFSKKTFRLCSNQFKKINHGYIRALENLKFKS